MSRVISVLVWLAIAVWSVVSLGTYFIVRLIGGSLSRNADAYFGTPELVVFMADTFGFFTTIGLGAVIVLWLAGTAALLASGWLARRIAA